MFTISLCISMWIINSFIHLLLYSFIYLFNHLFYYYTPQLQKSITGRGYKEKILVQIDGL